MKIVIDIPEEIIITCMQHNMPVDCELFARKIIEDIAKGKIIPKRHGRLIDADALTPKIHGTKSIVAVLEAPTIIEAEKGGE